MRQWMLLILFSLLCPAWGNAMPDKVWQPLESLELGFYQLTSADLAALAARQAQLEKLLALQDIVYTEQYMLDNAVRAALRPLVHDYEHYVTELVSKVPLPADTSAGADSQYGYVVSAPALARLQQQAAFAVLTEQDSALLDSLQDAVFRQQELLDTALDLLGFAANSTRQQWPVAKRELLYRQAFKSGPAASMAALQWQPVADCGCAPQLPAQAAFVNFSYALQPYWLNKPQLIDFGSLHRIGFYAFTIDSNHKLQAPPNWQNRRPFNEFINQAQAHNSYLDIVIKNQDMQLWQTANAHQALIDDIQALLNTPLQGYWLNNLQPLVTLGLSAKRTVADGITLDLDLRRLPAEQHSSVISFIKTLKLQLNQQQPTTDSDSYFVNLTVPISALLRQTRLVQDKTTAATQELGFYTLDNLLAVAPYVNLMLIRFDDKAQLDESAAEQAMPQFGTEVSEFRLGMQRLKSAIDSMEDSVKANILLEKMLPVFHMKYFADAGRFSNELIYANWNFSGAALWSLPLSDVQYSRLRAAFNPPVQTDNHFYKAYLSASGALCNLICPNRWQARLLLFSVVSLLALYGAVSLVVFELRILYRQRYFINFLLFQPFLMLLILWCDPFWHPYQNLVLVVALVITLLLQWYFRQQQRQREHYP